MYNQYSNQTNQMGNFNNNTAQFNRMMNSGKNSNKRSVSETKKNMSLPNKDGDATNVIKC